MQKPAWYYALCFLSMSRLHEIFDSEDPDASCGCFILVANALVWLILLHFSLCCRSRYDESFIPNIVVTEDRSEKWLGSYNDLMAHDSLTLVPALMLKQFPILYAIQKETDDPIFLSNSCEKQHRKQNRQSKRAVWIILNIHCHCITCGCSLVSWYLQGSWLFSVVCFQLRLVPLVVLLYMLLYCTDCHLC